MGLALFAKKQMNIKIINFLAFQAGWFLLVFCAYHGKIWMALAFTAFVLALYLVLSRQKLFDTVTVVAVTLIGTIWDYAIYLTGIVNFQSVNGIHVSFPVWMCLMWVLFSTTVNYSLSWLRDKLWLTPIFGLTLAPMAYYAGVELLVISRSTSPLFFFSQGLGWALMLPVFFLLNSWLKKLFLTHRLWPLLNKQGVGAPQENRFD